MSAALDVTSSPDTETRPHICWDCGGPCLTYKGTDHGWRCAACCAAYVERGAVAGETAVATERAKQLAKQRRSSVR